MTDFPPELIQALQEAQDAVFMDGFGTEPPGDTLQDLVTSLHYVGTLNSRSASRAKTEVWSRFYAQCDSLFSQICYLLTQAEITLPEGVEWPTKEINRGADN